MPSSEEERIIPLLRRLAHALMDEKGFSGSELDKAKAIATKLYILHTNRKISLNATDFDAVLSIIGYGNHIE